MFWSMGPSKTLEDVVAKFVVINFFVIYFVTLERIGDWKIVAGPVHSGKKTTLTQSEPSLVFLFLLLCTHSSFNIQFVFRRKNPSKFIKFLKDFWTFEVLNVVKNSDSISEQVVVGKLLSGKFLIIMLYIFNEQAHRRKRNTCVGTLWVLDAYRYPKWSCSWMHKLCINWYNDHITNGNNYSMNR